MSGWLHSLISNFRLWSSTYHCQRKLKKFLLIFSSLFVRTCTHKYIACVYVRVRYTKHTQRGWG